MADKDKTKAQLLEELETLRESEKKHRLLYETMAQGVVYQAADGQIISANPAAERMLGLTLDQMQGRTSADPRWKAIHKDGSAFPGEAHPAMVALKTGKEVHDVAMGVFNPLDDDYRWLNINARPLFNPGEDTPYQVYTTFSDITALKRAEEALRANEAILNATGRMAKVGGWELDVKTHEIRWTDEIYHIYEMPLDSKPILDQIISYFHPLDRPKLAQAFQRALDDGEPYDLQLRFTTLTGKPLWTHTICKPQIVDGQVVSLLGTFQDITERKRIEETNHEIREYLTHLMNSLASVVFTVKMPERQIEYVNNMISQLFGIAPEKVIGQTTRVFYPDDESYRAFGEKLQTALREGQSIVRTEQELQKKDGTIFWADIATRFIFTNDQLVQVISIIEDITERKQAEAALRESEEQLQRATHAGNVGLWDWDLRTNQVYYSPEWKRQLGYENYEISNDFDEWQSRVHPDDLKQALQTVQTFITTPWPDYQLECRLRHKDGNYRWILAQADLLEDERGQPIRMLGSHIDITERKQAEQALQESEYKFRLLSEQSLLGIAIMQDDEIKYANQAIADLNERALDKFVGWKMADFAKTIHPDDMAFAIEQARKKQRGDTDIVTNYSYRIITGTGQIRWISQYSKTVLYDGRPANLVTLIDITKLKQAEEAYRVLVDSSLQGLVLTKDSKILFANQAWQNICGYTLEELQRMSAEETVQLIHPDDRALVMNRHWKRLAGHSETQNYTCRIIHKKGQVRWVEMYTTKTIYHNEPVIQIAILDITERKQAEQQRLELELEKKRAEILAKMVQDIKHEAGTSLTVVYANLHLLKKRVDPANGGIQLARVEQHTKYLERLFDNMLTMTRLDAGSELPLEEIDLNAAVKMVELRFGSTVRNKALILAFDLSPDIPAMQVNPFMFEQLLDRIVENAVQHTPEGGTITIQTWPDSNEVIIEIRDTGIGISEVELPHIFKRFYRVDKARSTRGAGLGLSIANRIIELHHGRIDVESESGKGSTFRICLPVNRDTVIPG